METLDNLEKIAPVAVRAMIGIRYFPKTELSKVAFGQIPTSKKGLQTEKDVVEIYREGSRGLFWEVYNEY